MEIEQKFEHFCRICTVEHEVGIMIFSEEGEKMMLRDKITKYLHLEIQFEDRLPKMICISCCTQLDSIRVFAEMARQSQTKLSKHLEIIDLVNGNGLKIISTSPVVDIKSDCVKIEKTEPTNGYGSPVEDDSDVTEMEVRLDPMMFLDCQTDDSLTNDSSSNCNDTTIKDILSCQLNKNNVPNIEDNNSLTIELVKKPDIKPQIEKKVKVLPDLTPIKLTRKNVDLETTKPFVCTLCPRSYLSSIALQNHSWMHLKNKAKEDGNGKVCCPICNKDISTKGNLKVHMETHRPKGKYTCDICGRIFKTYTNLFRHKEYHGGEVYTCNVCGRVYPTNSTLRAHSITHSDARPHNCPLCKKTFKRNQDLKFHINQHTGARPYCCPYCPKAFASSGNCFSHRKRMHPVEVERDRDKTHNSNSQ